MGLQIEIVERSSVIVVTLTGATDVGAIAPLQDALRVAASEGKTVVLDITELTRASSLTEIVDALGPAVMALKLVARPTSTLAQLPARHTEIYPSVGAAIAAIRDTGQIESSPTFDDLAAKFDVLRDRYAQMIEHCQQLLQHAGKPPENIAQASRDS